MDSGFRRMTRRLTQPDNAMHHSRLSTIVIDCRVDDLESAADFWSRAFGKPVESYDEDGDGKYARLATAADEPVILLQKVAHESRVHLDIETDDIEAETRRLEALGAKRVTTPHGGRWQVMEAPSGQRFCVVRRQRKEFGPHLNTWPD
jgi:predicted enzyme related to lactoylglutathione lyase